MTDPLKVAKSALIAGNSVSEAQATNMSASKAIAGRGQQFCLLSNRGSGATSSGNGGVSGTLIKNISQTGNAERDGNPLHLTLGRRSFFVTDTGFTRVGTWGFNKDGNCVNHMGQKIKCFRLNEDGERINPANGSPLSGNFAQTDMVTPNKNDITMNAAATSTVKLAYKLGQVDPKNTTTEADKVQRTDISIYDSLGGANNVGLNFTRAKVSGGHVTTESTKTATISALTADAVGQDVAAKAIADQLIATLGTTASFVNTGTGTGTLTIPDVPGTAETVYTITVPAGYNGGANTTIEKSIGGAAAVNMATFNTVTDGVDGASKITGYATAAALGATYVPSGSSDGKGTITIGSSINNPATTYTISTSGSDPYTTTSVRTTTVVETPGAATAWYLKVSTSALANPPTIKPPYAGDGILVEFDTSGNVLRFNNTAPGTPGSDIGAPKLDIQWENAAESSIDLNLSNLTNNGPETQIGHIDINGNTAGQFKSMEWDEEGNGIVIFTNNLQKKWFQIAQARFEAEDELRYDGDGTYTQTAGSGAVVYGYTGDGFFETMTPESLEGANISEIQTHVDMIGNQRYYMAQISVFKTAREMAQALDNL